MDSKLGVLADVISKKVGIKKEEMVLIYVKVISPSQYDKTLEEFGIRDNSHLTIGLRLLGGVKSITVVISLYGESNNKLRLEIEESITVLQLKEKISDKND